MNLLLDTHTLVWFLNGDSLLSSNALEFIIDQDNKKYVSMASIWEISIKIGLGKLTFDGGTNELVELIERNDFEILPISVDHVKEYEKLEFVHRDPFDRILVVQARLENMSIVTKDENIRKYQVQINW